MYRIPYVRVRSKASSKDSLFLAQNVQIGKTRTEGSFKALKVIKFESTEGFFENMKKKILYMLNIYLLLEKVRGKVFSNSKREFISIWRF